jgi:hypothetical protein
MQVGNSEAPRIVKKHFAFIAVASTAIVCGCASQPLEDTLQPSAVRAAQQRGASELGCPTAEAAVLRKRAIDESQATGWYEAPRNAEYMVAVSGCGERTTYLVVCSNFKSACNAGPLPTPTGAGPLGQLADELQPDAIKAAQQRGAKDFSCPTMTPEVTRKQAIVEGATTGWGAEAPHRAVYVVTAKGCGKQTVYVVECDKLKKGCATADLQQTQTAPALTQLTDDLQADAVQAAEQRGYDELQCPAARAEVKSKQAIDEGQTTGWYEFPYRAIYAITVSGCGKETTYAVACNKKQERCVARNSGSR